MKFSFLIFLGLVIAILAVVFALQNPGIIVIKFLAWEFQGSMALILLITFTFGFITSLLISIAAFLKKKWQQEEKNIV